MTCIGCNLLINGVQVNKDTSDYQVGSTQNVLTNGYGAFAGITNFLVGVHIVEYKLAENGLCTGATGQTGCVQNQPCEAKVRGNFVGNPVLSGIAPGYTSTITNFPPKGGSVVYNTSSTVPDVTFTPYQYVADCGTLELDVTTFNFVLPGYSGGFSGSVTTSFLCTSCSGTV